MEIENEKRKKKPKKIVKRKSFRKDKNVNVEDVATKVDGMRINKGNDGLGIPDIYVEESRSQPGSRRNSNIPGPLLLNPSEVTRRASMVPTEITRRSSNASMIPTDITRRSSNASMIPDGSSYVRRESQDTTRRGSIKRGSISWEEEEALEAKKLKATLEAMGMIKKKQKEFTWDSVQQEKKEEEDPSVSRRKSSVADSKMNKEIAMKVLGLTNKKGEKILRPRLVTDYTEFEILIAFQRECNKATKAGDMKVLQDVHEAYQVISKILKAKNNFKAKAEAKKEKQIKIMGQVEKASAIWKRRSSLLNAQE